MTLPLTWWSIIAAVAAALGIGASKLAALTAGAFKLAAVGTSFTLKTVVFTKLGAASIAVSVGASAYPEVVDATLGAITEFGYKSENSQNIPIIKQEINIVLQGGGTYQVRYCSVEGAKVIVPSNYQFCPHDGSEPVLGHDFVFTD